MSSITIRNLPAGVKENLARRAKEGGESLEAYVRRMLDAATTESPKSNRLRFPDNLVALGRELSPQRIGEDIELALHSTRTPAGDPVDFYDRWEIEDGDAGPNLDLLEKLLKRK